MIHWWLFSGHLFCKNSRNLQLIFPLSQKNIHVDSRSTYTNGFCTKFPLIWCIIHAVNMTSHENFFLELFFLNWTAVYYIWALLCIRKRLIKSSSNHTPEIRLLGNLWAKKLRFCTNNHNRVPSIMLASKFELWSI